MAVIDYATTVKILEEGKEVLYTGGVRLLGDVNARTWEVKQFEE